MFTIVTAKSRHMVVTSVHVILAGWVNGNEKLERAANNSIKFVFYY